MGSKKILPQFAIIPTQTATGTITSSSTNISNLDNISIAVSWTGTVAATFVVNVSQDAILWEPLTFSPTLPAAAFTAGDFIIELTQIPENYVQLVATVTGGTGNLTATIIGKDLN